MFNKTKTIIYTILLLIFQWFFLALPKQDIRLIKTANDPKVFGG